MLVSAWLAMMGSLSAPQPRLDLIWQNVDARISRQVDVDFDDGNFPRVVQLLEYQFTYSESDYDVATNLGWMYENTDRDEDAIGIYRQYYLSNPRDPDNALPLVTYYSIRRKTDEIIELLAKSIDRRMHPNNYRLLSVAFERKKMYAEALKVRQIQLRYYPDDEPAKAAVRKLQERLRGSSK